MKYTITLYICLVGLLKLSAQAPDWQVNTNNYQGTMTITGILKIDGFESRDTADVIGIFAGEECRGIAQPIYSAALDRYLVFVSVFGDEMPEFMTFQVYEAARDSIFTSFSIISYSLNATLGTIGAPYAFEVGQLPFEFGLEDKDEDGFFTDTDCDDNDPSVNPGAFELPGDNIDQNCNQSLEVEIPQVTYVNDFNEFSSDFNNSGFSIRQEDNFEDSALHSNHPYGDRFVDDELNFFSILNIPIIVDDQTPTIRFQEIVLVEPGVEGATYPDAAFRDYVIVEARKANQVDWTPLVDAYDARANADWLQTYNSAIDPFGGTSTAEGTQNMYQERVIDISQHFSAGDTLKIRFRLYSDFFDYGWGWAIDDLEIQKAVPTHTKAVFATHLFQAFPNPLVGSTLYLETDQFDPGRTLQIRLCDAFGKVVFMERRQLLKRRSTIPINLARLPGGLYFIQLNNGIKRSSQKIIKAQN